MKKNCCSVNYPESYIHIRDKAKVLSDLWNHATKKIKRH